MLWWLLGAGFAVLARDGAGVSGVHLTRESEESKMEALTARESEGGEVQQLEDVSKRTEAMQNLHNEQIIDEESQVGMLTKGEDKLARRFRRAQRNERKVNRAEVLAIQKVQKLTVAAEVELDHLDKRIGVLDHKKENSMDLAKETEHEMEGAGAKLYGQKNKSWNSIVDNLLPNDMTKKGLE